MAGSADGNECASRVVVENVAVAVRKATYFVVVTVKVEVEVALLAPAMAMIVERKTACAASARVVNDRILSSTEEYVSQLQQRRTSESSKTARLQESIVFADKRKQEISTLAFLS